MTANIGPTTVGPDTTKIAPVMTAAPNDMPRSGRAHAAAIAKVMGTPTNTSLGTTRRARPRTTPYLSDRPAS